MFRPKGLSNIIFYLFLSWWQDDLWPITFQSTSEVIRILLELQQTCATGWLMLCGLNCSSGAMVTASHIFTLSPVETRRTISSMMKAGENQIKLIQMQTICDISHQLQSLPAFLCLLKFTVIYLSHMMTSLVKYPLLTNFLKTHCPVFCLNCRRNYNLNSNRWHIRLLS